eukprot:4693534-Lingulodinium_polyedra.AAC.1
MLGAALPWCALSSAVSAAEQRRRPACRRLLAAERLARARRCQAGLLSQRLMAAARGAWGSERPYSDCRTGQARAK